MTPTFNDKLTEYAHLLVEVGLNVKKGELVRIQGPVDCAPFVRLCAGISYECGAGEVIVEWTDDTIMRQRFLHAADESFTEFPEYLAAKSQYFADKKALGLSIIGSDPEALAGVDSERIRNWSKASAPKTRVYRDLLMASYIPWCVGAHATASWAKMVFPDKPEEEAIEALWEAIFKTCRITGDGTAVARWKEHEENLARRSKLLNEMNLQYLHYTNSLGTDLTIELPENAVWAGGSEPCAADGRIFLPNIPTEEIFSAPKRDGVNGRVYSALPLALDGNLIENFYMDFENGKIVNVYAEKGQKILEEAITEDEGASYLGEVALVPFDSPIRNTGILFYNTLFDENASCHLAFGAAYASCVKGGEKMTEDEQKAAGLNHSITHVDFMIGTEDFSIVGKSRDGKEFIIFKDGNFVF